ncbi:helix-turn-helix transcriptional regulator [Nocardioides coralli]|uniref:helix-turn-helix transcriptional regulator n=1 Tax=Nocardioides coralli TaxID=2872154 RepID=UPI001CA435EC|nr:helix-turn-helix transcriptional regulator [Nocardioides coralli]QZY29789.1 helix-turn-helix domain-containing protein [Nocardioides coralli]
MEGLDGAVETVSNGADVGVAVAIKRRRIGLGLKSVREFAERSGVSREAVTAAERGMASQRTYERLEAWLESAERERGTARDDNVVEFRLTGEAGIDVVVRGPVTDMSELEATVTRLIREMRGVSA